jgi:protein involved in polysaccharide export with SLBB domain
MLIYKTAVAVCIIVPLLSMPTLQGQTSASAHVPEPGSAALAQLPQQTQTEPGQPQFEERHPRYKIQCQDVLLLSFPLSPELNQTVTVQPDGYINLQNVGSLFIRDLTVPELVVALKSKFAGTLHDPIINVDIGDFQKPFFFASGQVGKPGQYDLRSDITVAEAIAVAGGLTQGAKGQLFLFHRTSEGWFKVRQIKINDILHGKALNEDATIQPGDMIYVPAKFIEHFREYVPYSLSAGTYLSPSGSL